MLGNKGEIDANEALIILTSQCNSCCTHVKMLEQNFLRLYIYIEFSNTELL